jgi:hypothetical protein
MYRKSGNFGHGFILGKKKDKKVQIREYKYKKILRQCSILAVNFWNVTYFGVFNFGTSYLGAKIGQNKTCIYTHKSN